MAQSGFTPILTYASNTASSVPSAGNLTNSANGAELAVNTADKRLFVKNSGGTVVELGTAPSTLSVSGTTTLSGLTASTALALDASKNVVSVTNTGTGNNVLATSPVLTTPNLGTPSAVTLTNATGLPVSTGISGLGTGVATALAVNTGAAGAFVVNGGALGTPSSGTVTNLTGTASININGTVGATTPNTGAFTTLSVSGVVTISAGTAAAPALTTIGDTDTGVWFPAANTWSVATGGFERMRISSNGDVAIGGQNAVTKLAIYDSNVGLVVLNTSDPAAATSAPMLRHPVASGFSSTPAFSFWYSNAGMSMPAAETLGLVTNSQERMRITSGGNVGIGTSAPDNILTISASDTSNSLSNSTAAITLVNSNSDAFGRTTNLNFNQGNSLLAQRLASIAAIYTNFTSSVGGALAFSTNNGSGTVAERMRVTSGGDVGIGTTNPVDRLDVVGNIRASAELRLSNDQPVRWGTSDSATIIGKSGTSGGYLKLSANNEIARVKSEGQFRFIPRATDPGNAEAGDVYYNSGTNKLRVYNGTAWVDLH